MRHTLRTSWIFWVGLALTVLCTLYSMFLRHRVESRNKAVAIAYEATVLQSAASAEGISLADAVQRLKEDGLGAIVLAEESARQRVDRGDLQIDLAKSATRPGFTYVSAGFDEELAANFSYLKVEKGAGGSAWIPMPVSSFLETPVGLNPHEVSAAQSAGLPIIARFANRLRLDRPMLDRIFTNAKASGVLGYLPQGDEVIGFRSQMKDAAEALQAAGLYYISPEFAKIAGEERMTQLCAPQTIRLHAIQSAEADRMTPGAFVERFGKAYSERNMRILLIRPLQPSSPSPLASIEDTLGLLERGIQKEHGTLGLPKPFSDANVPSLLFRLIAAGIAISIAGIAYVSIPSPVARGLTLAACAVMPAFPISITALLGATFFPVAAFIFMRRHRDWSPWLLLLVLAGVSLVGGFCVAGLLNGVPYYVRAETFSGVKLAHFFPIFLIGLLLLTDAINVKEMLSRPLTIGGLILGVAALFALAFMAARTGNDSPAGVSSAELAFRSLLEKFLMVRPRTKEFLIGHPALMLGLLLQAQSVKTGKHKLLASILLIVGSIGLTSTVNTLCHLHTPLAVGLTRILLGWILGIVIGLGIWMVVKKPLLQGGEQA